MSLDGRSIGTLNIALSVAMWILAAGLLRWASIAVRSDAWLELAGVALIFSFAGNTLFSLLHEATHGLLHPRPWLNDLTGTVCAAFFPTGYQFQRACHLGHHARNRTELETFDYIYPDDIRWLKTLQWYGILTPLYWLTVVCGWVGFAVAPGLLRALASFGRDSTWAEHSSGTAYLEGLDAVPPVRARLELLFTVAFQLTLFVALDLAWQAWLVCYLAFAFNWSALQYTDHAFSPLDVKEGAWDLRVPTWWRWTFLNYHCHRAHHLNPRVSWIDLPRYVDAEQPQPSFFRHYVEMWKGPRDAPGPPAASA